MVHDVKNSKNNNKTSYFDMVFQTSKDESKDIRVMLNTFETSKRQMMLQKLESEQPLFLSNLRTTSNGTIFMNQSIKIKGLPAHLIPFAFKTSSPDKITQIGTILTKHDTGIFNLSGAVSWSGPESVITDRNNQERRVRDAIITDQTGKMELSISGNQIEKIKTVDCFILSQTAGLNTTMERSFQLQKTPLFQMPRQWRFLNCQRMTKQQTSYVSQKF